MENVLWLVVCLKFATFVGRLGEAAAPGGVECGPFHDFASGPWHLPYNWGKSRENLSQGFRKALGWPAPNAIPLVDLAIVRRWPQLT